MSKKANTFQTPIGTRDLLPGESSRWEAVSLAMGRMPSSVVDVIYRRRKVVMATDLLIIGLEWDGYS